MGSIAAGKHDAVAAYLKQHSFGSPPTRNSLIPLVLASGPESPPERR